MTFLWRSRGARINTYYQPPIQFKALGKTRRTWSLGRVPKLLGKFQLSYNNHRQGEAAPTTMAPLSFAFSGSAQALIFVPFGPAWRKKPLAIFAMGLRGVVSRV